MRRSRISFDPEITLTSLDLKRVYNYIDGLIDLFPERTCTDLISEFAAEHRTLPDTTPYPGPWDNSLTPQLVEPMNRLIPSSGFEELAFVKSVQAGATAGLLENWYAYIIKKAPGPILHVSANDKLLEKWTNKRFNPLIKSCGLEDYISAQFVLKGQRRSGNTAFSKEFPGGSLDLVTANAPGGLRQDSIRYIGFDEVEGYKETLVKEGDPIEIALARASNWKHRKRVVYISTPGDELTSRIWPLFERGDRRHFHVPCPFCGTFQPLEWGDKESQSGMYWETKAGLLDGTTIGYFCTKCRDLIRESHKYVMMNNGHWEAHAKTQQPRFTSYHMNNLINLMRTWESIILKYLKDKDDPEKYKAFVNLELGLPSKETGTKPKLVADIRTRSSYKIGEVPKGVLFLTCGVDVQQGSKDNKDFPPRLEMEFLGNGKGFRTWSIDYKIFDGPIDDPYDGAWLKFTEWAEDTKLEFKRADGKLFKPVLTFIDSGQGQFTDVVYQFCSDWGNTIPCKGAKKEDIGLDELRSDTYRYYRLTKIGGIQPLCLVHTNQYKRQVYNALNVKADEKKIRPRFCSFPKGYTKRYFEQLTAAELLEDGSFRTPKGRRDESLSCRVYATAASHFWLDEQVKRIQNEMRSLGREENWIKQNIHMPYILNLMEKNS